MCTFRRVTVTWPDGRTARVLLREGAGEPVYCNPCGLSVAGFRRRGLAPHDDLEHLELYYGAKVKRGRRLSVAQAARYAADVKGGPWKALEYQPSMLGVLVDVGKP